MKNEILLKITNLLREGTIITYEGIESNVTAAKGASPQEISECNSFFENKLPGDYAAFLSEFNGIDLFNVEDIGGFRFFSCQQMMDENQTQKNSFGDDWDESIILIGLSLGDDDYLGLKVLGEHTYEILDCYICEVPSNWGTIGVSFHDFLEKLIDEKGKKFWLDD